MISDLEGGRRNPSVGTLLALAGALDVTTDYLLGRTERMAAASGFDRIRELLGHLREDDLTVIEKLCRYLVERNEARPADQG